MSIKKYKLHKIFDIAIIMVLICLFVFSTSCKKLDSAYQSSRLLNNLYVAYDSMFADGVAKKIIVPTNDETNTVESVGADAYVVASLDRFSSTFTKYHNPFKRMPMASLTKLMTFLIVIENCKDLNQMYTVSDNAVNLEKNASNANLLAGDKVKVIDLLYGLMLPSGNDAAIVLAENVAGGYENFILLMNNEAERIGALNTHFANPHGLDANYHFTTPYDLFLITRELTKYELFTKISSTSEYETDIEMFNGTVRKVKWINTNFFVTQELMISNNVELLGGKTGNTTNAGNCLVVYCKDKSTNVRYISVVLNAKSKRNMYFNTNALYSGITNSSE